MVDNVREVNLKKFRSSDTAEALRILVATNAIEEGIDIPKLSFVVVFNSLKTTKSWIQSAGRARLPDSKVYVFENEPNEEEKKNAAMQHVARNNILMPEMNSKVESVKAPKYDLGAGKLTIWNSPQIVIKFCQKALKRSFDPEKYLYEYADIKDDRKTIKKMFYPTPTGMQFITLEDVRELKLDLRGVTSSQAMNTACNVN